MTSPILTENGQYLTVQFVRGVGVVIETMGAKHTHRTILNRDAAKQLAEQIDLANLNPQRTTNK